MRSQKVYRKKKQNNIALVTKGSLSLTLFNEACNFCHCSTKEWKL